MSTMSCEACSALPAGQRCSTWASSGRGGQVTGVGSVSGECFSEAYHTRQALLCGLAAKPRNGVDDDAVDGDG